MQNAINMQVVCNKEVVYSMKYRFLIFFHCFSVNFRLLRLIKLENIELIIKIDTKWKD